MASTLKRRRIIVLVHKSLIPPDDISKLSPAEIAPFKTEFDVREGLRWLGHEVLMVGLSDELTPLRTAIEELKPHVVFNLLEEFDGEAIFDAHVVGYLELQRTRLHRVQSAGPSSRTRQGAFEEGPGLPPDSSAAIPRLSALPKDQTAASNSSFRSS